MVKQPIVILQTNTILYCQRWQETVNFYRQILGLQVVFENEWFVEFKIREKSFLSVANATSTSIQAALGKGITLTLKIDDLAQTHNLLSTKKIKLTPIQKKWGSNVFYCFDPDGHRIEFWS